MSHQQAFQPKTLTGLCIGVLSGDRVLFQGPPAKDTGIPIQKVLHLSSLLTPKVDLQGGNDEPFGYASRQYLRSRLVGRQVQFTIETKVNEIELGHIVYDGADISIGLLREGLAKIRGERAKGKNAEEYQAAQERARKDRKNLWSDKPEKEPLYSRRLSEKTVKQFSEEFQGTLLNGIIEEVQPSKFTVYFPQQRFIGRIESPELQVVVLSEKVEGGENKNNAKEIRSVLESKVLNREVQIFVRGLSPEGLISGHVKAENFDSRKTLLTFGYAKLSKDALNILDVNEFKDLKAISHEAATKLRGLWRDQRENTNKTKSLEQNFVAKVVEIISGDSVKIINLETNESSRIYLSNIKAPVPGKPFAFEAKESLRKKTIGKKVKVEVEFSKNIPIKKDNGSTEDRNFVFASVFESGKNIGVQLLEEGFVALQLPRGDDEFTKYIDDLKNADEEAKKKKKGLHGESVRVPVFNDITSGREGRYKVDITKSKSIFSFLKDEKRLSGVVEVVLNGSRLKIRMHQQSCYIILVLEGIRCLPNEGDFKKWSQQALEFSKENVSQRDVEIELSKIDKKGIFHGSIFFDKKNYALELLERGLAVNFGKVNPKYEDYEAIAKKNKVGLWSTPLNLAAIKGDEDKEYTPVNFVQTLKLVEVTSPTEFYLDTLNPRKPEVPQKGELSKNIREGELYAVRFTVDDVYYRARVKRIQKNGTYHVHYIDFGNSENVPATNINILSEELKKEKPSIFKCGLYGVDNLSAEATKYLTDLLDCEFKVEFKEECSGEYNVILHDKDGTINEDVLAHGLGQCTAEIPAWQELERKAKADFRGVWQQQDD